MNLEDRNRPARVPEGAQGRRRIRILLVDDNEDFRREAARYLAADHRCQVVGFAESGIEAIDLARRLEPDLVLMDLSMPGMNGLEAARRIKERVGSPYVVIVTLEKDAPYRSASRSFQIDAFLSKMDFVDGIGPLLDRLFPYWSGASDPQTT